MPPLGWIKTSARMSHLLQDGQNSYRRDTTPAEVKHPLLDEYISCRIDTFSAGVAYLIQEGFISCRGKCLLQNEHSPAGGTSLLPD